MSEILKFNDFSLNEEIKFPPKRKKSNLDQNRICKRWCEI